METTGLIDVLEALKYTNAVEVIDEVLAVNPAANVSDVRRYASDKKKLADLQLAAAETRIERAVCRYCKTEIARSDDGTWHHGRVYSWGSRGCRSYSYERLGIWDDNLDRRWRAAPA